MSNGPGSGWPLAMAFPGSAPSTFPGRAFDLGSMFFIADGISSDEAEIDSAVPHVPRRAHARGAVHDGLHGGSTGWVSGGGGSPLSPGPNQAVKSSLGNTRTAPGQAVMAGPDYVVSDRAAGAVLRAVGANAELFR